MAERILIVKGDDTDWNGQHLLTLHLDTEILDLSQYKATLTLGSVVKTFNDISSGTIVVDYTSAETSTFNCGMMYGVLRLFTPTTSPKRATIESKIPFYIVNTVSGTAIATEPYQMTINVEQGGENILNISVEAGVSVEVGSTTTLPAGSDATVTNSGVGNHLVLDFGIPKGDKGDQGEQGEQGETGADGYSPSAIVNKVGNTATITITDKDGTTSASVNDGSNAIINGVNTLSLTASDGLVLTQTGSSANISGGNLQNQIYAIDSVIPSQATSLNQLADKNFVNSSVQTATANYRGSWENWTAVPNTASGYPEDYAGNKTPTVNDYLVVRDASDYTQEELTGTWRFKYSGTWDYNGKSGWLPEYQVNEEPLTAAQLAALNSGATTENIALAVSALQAGDDVSKLNNDAGYVTALTAPVTDVKVNGTSVVTSGVANLPKATDTTLGLLRTSGSRGITTDANGVLAIANKSYADYTAMGMTSAISKGTLENVLTGRGLYQRSVYDGTKAITSGSIALEDSVVFYTDSPSANTTYTIDSTALTKSGLTCRYFNVLIDMPSTAVGLDFTTNNTIVWTEGQTPDMSTGGRTYLLAFQTFDGGTTWIGSLCTWWATPTP